MCIRDRIYANPIKTGGGLQACCDVGVHKMTFDSESEIVKMAQGCPGTTVLLRIRIDNSSAHVDLNKKFGVGRERAVELLQAAQAAGLDAAGVCFHVGSQTMSADQMCIRDRYNADTVILATGISRSSLLPGEKEFLGRGVSYCAKVDGAEYKGKRVAAIATVPDAMEEIEYLADICSEVIFIPRFQGFVAPKRKNVTVVLDLSLIHI